MAKTDEKQIIDLYRKENEAMVAKDITTLNKILVPSMHLRHMTGYVQPKLEWIDQIQNGGFQYFSSVEEKIKDIKINDNNASLIGQNKVKAIVNGGAVHTWPLQMKMYFVKDQGRWFITDQEASTY
ncbi:nuclear transport factor 2 family protein [Xylocopilactobacillus apis]|uniref:DUF4440 domain-containing protein n=1 Tax=Xylocopilactobacillus apis TaxID=2932183 RepID=A0AAU9CS65_9LACO|nr:nuclear transport factor 2 family protein [Xylocopilactobacillus apis]BDR56812.1 DUF4440 domain-containing protein [Xylocopilactobacillus apis]